MVDSKFSVRLWSKALVLDLDQAEQKVSLSVVIKPKALPFLITLDQTLDPVIFVFVLFFLFWSIDVLTKLETTIEIVWWVGRGDLQTQLKLR